MYDIRKGAIFGTLFLFVMNMDIKTKLHNELVNYYLVQSKRETPLQKELFLELMDSRSKVTNEFVKYSREIPFTNVHAYLSPIALLFMLHNEWIKENEFDKRYFIEGFVYYKGFDHRYPQDILKIFEESFLCAFPDVSIKKCLIRGDYDFKDVVYHYKGDL